MRERQLMKGNEIIAEASLRAGCKLFFGYPITPSTEIIEYLAKHSPAQGGTVVQAEDEIGAINMCFGAACTGQRVMTASSSPGISLKQEGISYSAACQLPIVIVNANRCGPGLGGLGATQSDYYQSTKGGGHGDYHLIVLAPSNAQELCDFTMDAFDLAEEYRNPVLLLTDGFLGQTMEPVIFPKREARVFDHDWAIGNRQEKGKRMIFEYALNNEYGETYNLALEKKYAAIAEKEQRFEEFYAEDAEYLIVSFGTTGRIAKSAVLNARAQGIKLGLIRPITLWPFPEKALARYKDTIKGVVCVELNAGQMITDVKLALNCQVPVHLFRRHGGMLPTEDEILAFVKTTFALSNQKEEAQ